uniref:Uncharacterized protein n=1 Tax=Melopsittacus undulatus TaxID=13146 RepID=A0A8V5FMV0_MELUD
ESIELNIILLFPFQGKFTLLRDTRTDGSFLVHHFLSFYLRGQPQLLWATCARASPPSQGRTSSSDPI